MPPEEENVSEVVERPSESRSEAGVVELARDGQTKTEDQREQEKKHHSLRMNYETPSSEDLPRLSFEFDDDGGLSAEVPQGESELPEKPPEGRLGGKGSAGAPAETTDIGSSQDDLEKDAEALYEAIDGVGTDEEAIFKALRDKTPEEIEQLRKIYKEKYDEDLDAELSSELSGDDLEAAEALMEGKASETRTDTPADKPADAPEKKTDSPEDVKKCEEARKDLEEDIDEKVKDKFLQDTLKDQIKNFEQRQPPVSAAERAEFYGQIDKLIEAKDPPARADLPKEAERQQLALQVLEQANKPTTIDQGQNQSCGAASLESRLYTTNPAAAARLVTEVATTGKLTPQPPGSGPAVDVHPSVLKPDEQAKESIKSGRLDSERGYASQIFQGAAITLEREGYRQERPRAGDAADTGERYKDGDFQGLTSKEVSDMEKKITGNAEGPPIIEEHHSDNPPFPGEIRVTKGDGAELQKQLNELKKQGKLPCVIAVDTGQEPFLSDSNGGQAGGSGGRHFVTVTDIDANGNVSIDNQWGETADHKEKSDPNAAQQGTIPASTLAKALN